MKLEVTTLKALGLIDESGDEVIVSSKILDSRTLSKISTLSELRTRDSYNRTRETYFRDAIT